MPHRIRNLKAAATDAQRELIVTLINGDPYKGHRYAVPASWATKARRAVGQPDLRKGRAHKVISGLLTAPSTPVEVKAAPKAKPAPRKAKATPKAEQTAMLYRIEVLKAKGWTERTIVPAASPDKALTGYGIRGRKVREGVRIADSGKKFRALNTGVTA